MEVGARECACAVRAAPAVGAVGPSLDGLYDVSGFEHPQLLRTLFFFLVILFCRLGNKNFPW